MQLETNHKKKQGERQLPVEMVMMEGRGGVQVQVYVRHWRKYLVHRADMAAVGGLATVMVGFRGAIPPERRAVRW